MSKNKELWQEATDLIGAAELNRKFANWICALIRKARARNADMAVAATYDSDIAMILADLNQRTKKRFGATDVANNAIIRLLKLNYTVEDFRRVHEAMAHHWLGDEKMERYLRPSTLYRPSNFDEYLAEWHKLEAQRLERERNRRRAQNRTQEPPPKGQDNAQRIRELNSVPWHSFDTWESLFKHVLHFPTAESADLYDMPAQLHLNRKRQGMVLDVLGGKCPTWAEDFFQKIKAEAHK